MSGFPLEKLTLGSMEALAFVASLGFMIIALIAAKP